MRVASDRSVAHGWVGLLLVAAAVWAPAASAADGVFWLPAPIDVGSITGEPGVLLRGLTGCIAVGDGPAAEALVAAGAHPLALGPGESLWLFLVEDAERAAFEPPARVLLRAGHEAILATGGETPQLTGASAGELRGLAQPVLVPRTLPITRVAGALPVQTRLQDPLIEQMVAALATSSYLDTWQSLEDFVTRYTLAPQNDLATQWMLDEFLAMGLDAEFHYYNQSGQRRNVVATLPGLVDPTKVVYITSHLDATSPTPSTCAPGADDNGSGTAAVIEVARVLSQYAFEYTVKFACFNGEEQGLIGSGAYVADIAAAGEDVIADFNADMIAYRGTDPAPADLIIYTNTASQPLATTLRDAALTYLPGLLQPIVVNEAISASDHASFWNYGYRAVLAIEEEAWGSDFCPWYHTCDDLIFRYPQDYVVNCSKALLAAVAGTALPMNPAGPWLVLEEAQLDDDENGASQGDGDGVANPGETIELWVSVGNVGTEAATLVSGQLTSTSPLATVNQGSAAWNDIPPAGQGVNLTPFLFTVSGLAGDGDMLPFTLLMSDATGSRELTLNFSVVAPDLAYYLHRLDDVTSGNGSGILEPGETVHLAVTIANRGGKDATGVQAVLSTESAAVIVLDGAAAAAQIPVNGQGLLGPAYRIDVAPGASLGEVVEMDLAITAGSGYQAASGFKLKLGTHFFDDVEADGAWLLAAAGDDATTGRWVRVDPVGTLQNGQPCQSEDDHTSAPGTDCFVTGQGAPGGAPGDGDVDSGRTTLTTPEFDLRQVVEPRIVFWRWYTNNLGNNGGQDEWVVQLSNNGGASWVDLERTTQSLNAWSERSFLVETYLTPTDRMVVRFIASDASPGSLVEAAVDDFEITGVANPVAVGGAAQAVAFRLDAARPSPVRGAAAIAFAVPRPGDVRLALFGVDGRAVRVLVAGSLRAGEHKVTWDGRNDAGVPVAPGVYFCRLQVDGETETRRAVVVR